MLKRNPIVGRNTKKRLIHPNLMLGEDTRKAVGGDGVLEIRTKPPNPNGDIKRRISCHWETSKKDSLGQKYVGAQLKICVQRVPKTKNKNKNKK